MKNKFTDLEDCLQAKWFCLVHVSSQSFFLGPFGGFDSKLVMNSFRLYLSPSVSSSSKQNQFEEKRDEHQFIEMIAKINLPCPSLLNVLIQYFGQR